LREQSRDLKEAKDLHGDLNQESPNDRVGDRNFVNVAPLQLREEVLHFEAVVPLNFRAGTIFSASASKPGSPCSEASSRSNSQLKAGFAMSCY
jgi:hypothetical protein